MKSILFAFAASTMLLVAPAHAQVRVSEPWVRATVPQQKATGAFMRLNSPNNSKLVSASSPVAAIVEIHEMAMENDVMRMRQVAGVDLSAGKQTELKPGGFHIMLIDLKQQVKEGDTVPLQLVFQDAAGKRETVDVKAPVRALNAAATPAAQAGHSPH
ncbi:copper chaperone PCu(A)C [Massilia sp. DWR3-1-1]|uniref:copper chaperone PCu(A)C n=1 Tax=Massilia sp. DWR3-1-1 TaxID=2804559 RepID=UPI003CF607BD